MIFYHKEVLIMSDNEINSRSQNSTSTVWQIVGRLVTAAIVLAITAFFTPGFSISNFWALAAAAIVLTIIDYLIVKFTGLHASAFGKGFVGFVLSAVVLYVTQYFVAGYTISWIAAIVGAIVYGVVDYFLPGEQQM
ncbi:MAG TPA: phage holin family protein [Clostridiaceae bacterium]|nr:phage holin family protein [Clostridiaceae bacterium]